MSAVQLGDDDAWTVVNSLRVAAEVYLADAIRARAAGTPRIAEQFLLQQERVLRLADELEQEVA